MRKAISQKTIKMLYAASGNVCAFKGCNTKLVDLASNALLGEMCHINAVSLKTENTARMRLIKQDLEAKMHTLSEEMYKENRNNND